MTTITSKFTKERLIDWAVVAVAERGRDLKDAPESVEAAANLKLAEIALAALTAEPVRYLNKFSGTCVTLEQQSNAADDVAVYMPLYAAPPVQETGIYKDMLNIISLLEKNEWAEHCTSTVLGSLLESEITRLVSKEQPAPVVLDEEQSREAFEQWCSVNIERNKWHPEFYAHLPAREQWAAWEASELSRSSSVTVVPKFSPAPSNQRCSTSCNS